MKKHIHCKLIKAWADGAEIEIKKSNGCWESIPSPSWGRDLVYRIKPVKPSIDWSVISDELQWLAVDENGIAFMFKSEPYRNGLAWFPSNMESPYPVDCVKSYSRGNCDWKESLVKRPD